MSESIKFGDIFRYKEEEYVFLAKTDEIVYAGQILDKAKTRKIDDLCEKRFRGNIDSRIKNLPLYCYVMLYTDEFKDRMAFLGKTGEDEFDYTFDLTGQTLNEQDIFEIKKEIIDPSSPIPGILRELIEALDI